eukprot:364861-Chlamydomonas_euryale.AAC.4
MFQIPASQMSEHLHGYMPVELGTVGTAEYGSQSQSYRERTLLGAASQKRGAGRRRPTAKPHQTPPHDQPSCRPRFSHRRFSATKFPWTCKRLWKAERHQLTRLAGAVEDATCIHTLRGSPVHAGHSLGGTAQSSGRRQDCIKAVRAEAFPLGDYTEEASRATVDNASGVVGASIWVGDGAPKKTTLEH